MKVKDFLFKDVETVKPQTTLKEILRIFKKFHSPPILPVVDEDNNILGVIRIESILKIFVNIPEHLKSLIKYPGDHEQDEILNIEVPPDAGELFIAEDIMDLNYLWIDEDADIEEARRIMKLNRINILPVLKEGKLKGLISEFDILLGVLKEKGLEF